MEEFIFSIASVPEPEKFPENVVGVELSICNFFVPRATVPPEPLKSRITKVPAVIPEISKVPALTVVIPPLSISVPVRNKVLPPFFIRPPVVDVSPRKFDRVRLLEVTFTITSLSSILHKLDASSSPSVPLKPDPVLPVPLVTVFVPNVISFPIVSVPPSMTKIAPPKAAPPPPPPNCSPRLDVFPPKPP